MERLSDGMIEILNQLHTERLDYTSEYLPLIDGANRLAEYEATGLVPEEVKGWQDIYCEILSRTYGPFHQKIADWLNAEKDGRLVIIPEPSAGLECDLLEPMKVGYALKSEVVKLNMRLSRDPKSVNRLDYTIIAALQAVLEGGGSDG